MLELAWQPLSDCLASQIKVSAEGAHGLDSKLGREMQTVVVRVGWNRHSAAARQMKRFTSPSRTGGVVRGTGVFHPFRRILSGTSEIVSGNLDLNPFREEGLSPLVSPARLSSLGMRNELETRFSTRMRSPTVRIPGYFWSAS